MLDIVVISNTLGNSDVFGYHDIHFYFAGNNCSIFRRKESRLSNRASQQRFQNESQTMHIDRKCTMLSFRSLFKMLPEEVSSGKIILEGASYISYKRRDMLSGVTTMKMLFLVREIGYHDYCIDNSWFAPYYPSLLQMFHLHFDFELFMSNFGSVK